MNRRQIIIVSVLVAIMVGIMSLIFSKSSPKTEKRAVGKLPVKYVKTLTVSNESIPYTLTGYGRLMSFKNINLSAEVSGKLIQGDVLLKPGANFSKGDILFHVDQTEAKYGLLARKSAFLSALALALADLKIDFPDAYQKWFDFYENVDVDQALPALPEISGTKEKTFLASKNVLGEYYGIKADEARLNKYNVIAPFNGSFVEVFAEPGANVNPGNNIASIIQEDKLEAKIPVEVDNLHLIQKGQPVELYNKAGEAVGMAEITRITRSINPNTQTIDVFAGLTNSESNQILVAGMFVNTTISSGVIPNAIEVPRRAMLNTEQLYVLTDSTLSAQSVTVEKTNPETFIVSGLKNGAVVVIEPVSAFSQNQKFAVLK